jgi:hypothetical protein
MFIAVLLFVLPVIGFNGEPKFSELLPGRTVLDLASCCIEPVF